jgi:hypothetical protein
MSDWLGQLWVINGPRAASELGPLIPGQRTCSDYFNMSVSCQQATSIRLFDQLVGASEQGQRNDQAKCLRSFEVDYQYVF